ncbi:hypothetical protein KC19_5G112000 [Ceratodon purpureus]|uniref:Secreted protein n=1 Tax=Ceratodon purpureus TaxID=3225 RepID=A0A8T0I076_CERPU|nr:hypothetical protein KC19_5G112000 [Ceratodon purpureus]
MSIKFFVVCASCAATSLSCGHGERHSMLCPCHLITNVRLFVIALRSMHTPPMSLKHIKAWSSINGSPHFKEN